MPSMSELCPTLMQIQISNHMPSSLVYLVESENSQMRQRKMMRCLNVVLPALGLHSLFATPSLPVHFIILVMKIHHSLAPIILLLSNTHPLPSLHLITYLIHHLHPFLILALVLSQFLFLDMFPVIPYPECNFLHSSVIFVKIVTM